MNKQQTTAGVDSGGNSFRLSICQDGEVLVTREYVSSIHVTADDLVQQIVSTMTELLKEHHLAWADLDRFGAGFPHPVSDTGVILGKSNRTHESWDHGCEMQAKLTAAARHAGLRDHAPVIVRNDCQMAILSAIDDLPVNKRKRALFLGVGSGVGGSMLIDGHVPSSPHGGCEPGRTKFNHIPFGLSSDPRKIEWRQLEHSASLGAKELLLAGDTLLHLGLDKHDELISKILIQGFDAHKLARAILPMADLDVRANRMNTGAVRVMFGEAKILGQYIAMLHQALRFTAVLIGGGTVNTHRTSEVWRRLYIAEILSSVKLHVDTQFVVEDDLVQVAAHGDDAGTIGCNRATHA